MRPSLSCPLAAAERRHQRSDEKQRFVTVSRKERRSTPARAATCGRLRPMPVDAVSQTTAPPTAEPPSGIVNCAAYAGGKRVATVGIDDLGTVVAPPDEFVWLGLHEPSEELLQKVQRALGLHDLAIEDAHTAHQRPKLEQ